MNDITVGVLVEDTIGSGVPFRIGRIFDGVLGVCVGAILGSDAPFDIFCTFGDVGGVIHCRIVAISTSALVVSSPYVRDGIGDFCDCKIAIISHTACR